MTVDEQFNKLEDDIRKLKVEYEVYFNGSSPRPPHDTLFRVENTIKRHSSDQSKLSLGQRFRFSNLVQRYAVSSQLWRRRLQEKEEGRSLTGVQKRSMKGPPLLAPVSVVCSDPDVETDKVNQLLQAMNEARLRTGQADGNLDPAAFHKFIKDKTRQAKHTLGCEKVQFSVSVEKGKIKFRATAAE